MKRSNIDSLEKYFLEKFKEMGIEIRPIEKLREQLKKRARLEKY